MDEKILIYIIIGIIYFLFNRLKKNPQQEEGDSEKPASPVGNGSPRPLTFEELLKEITEGKQSKPAEPVREIPKAKEYKLPQPQPAYVDYDDDIEKEEESLEKVSFDQERINQIYEDAKKLAFNRPSLEETVSLVNVNTTFGKFKAFEVKERNLLHDYTKDLRDPKGFKKALILSEVLNRKHF